MVEESLFFWLFETAIVNAYILFTKNKPENAKVRQRVFMKNLVKQLVGDKQNKNKRSRPPSIEQEERLNGKLHVLMPLEGKKLKDYCLQWTRPGKAQWEFTNRAESKAAIATIVAVPTAQDNEVSSSIELPRKQLWAVKWPIQLERTIIKTPIRWQTNV
ncbi:hypothetical protein J6590_093799 [Homalodisca vitripennis]|nr:hypothetical protein J6590_093799 [Homalodisca vitripennis]